MKATLPSWLTGTLSKHEREAMECLRDLLDTASMTGQCTAEDIKHPPIERNVIGATFKRLRACGLFQTDERVKTKSKSRHGRPVHVWKVKNFARLEQVRAGISAMNRQTLLRQEPEVKSGQYLLGV